MTQAELNEVIRSHGLWLKGVTKGRRALLVNQDLAGLDLSGANLARADLSGSNLPRANLANTCLDEAYLYRANLEEANLSGARLDYACIESANLHAANLAGTSLADANLTDADLHRANLKTANLSRAYLTTANLTGSNLVGANLSGANLLGANLAYADLTDANLAGAYMSGVDLTRAKLNFPMACPSQGQFIAWKKTKGYIVKLSIPEDARRSSSTGRKCRCDKAKVLAIEAQDGRPYEKNEVISSWDCNFVYRVGKEVSVPDYEVNRWKECAPGIHFFMTRDEAVNWLFPEQT